jgi:hypothetical protein
MADKTRQGNTSHKTKQGNKTAHKTKQDDETKHETSDAFGFLHKL